MGSSNHLSRSVYLGVLALISAAMLWLSSQHQMLAGAVQNPMQVENGRTGTSDWRLTNSASNREIEGFASATSVNRGGQITFFVNTKDPSYTIEVFRTGWYGGLAGRRETQPVTLTGIAQPIPTPDPTTGLAECNWSGGYTLTVSNTADPTDWVSGIYLAKLTGSSGNQSYIIFVVRDDSRPSDLIYQSTETTFQAYNAWGGKSLYNFNSTNNTPAVKVSFNRPYDDGEGTGQFLSYEFDGIAYLESQGYDVTYSTDIDTHAPAAPLTQHKGWLTMGHDEYWSYEMRQNVTAARDAGVGLGFFVANSIYWQIRFEPSLLDGTANRTIVGYKENWQNDPDAQNTATYYLVTTRWRDSHVTLPPSPEDALIGVMYNGHEPVDSDIIISNPGSWVLNGTGLKAGDHLVGLLGYEVDVSYGNAPANTEIVAHTPYVFSGDHSTQYSDMTDYQAPSGAWVFAAGTVRWPWGLSNVSPWGPSSSRVSTAAQIMTNNVLNRFLGIFNPSPTPTPSTSATPARTATPTRTATGTRTPTPSATATPGPSVTLSPTSLNFPNQIVGTTSGPQNVALSNPSSFAVAISSISSSAEFPQTNNCPSSLSPAASCTISISFKPAKNGRRSGTLTVTDNAARSPQTVALKGMGANH